MTQMKYGVPFEVDHIPTSSNRRPAFLLDWDDITVHSTANLNSTARGERKWLTNPQNRPPRYNKWAGWHLCVDEEMLVEAIPLDENAWHAGDGEEGYGNRNTVSIEICESGNRAKTLDNAAKVIAGLLREKGKTLDNVKRHKDWNGKNCPRIFNEETWNEFLKSIEYYLKGEQARPSGTFRRVYVQGVQKGSFKEDESLIDFVRERIIDGNFPIEIKEVTLKDGKEV